jgi:hypothetical protein
MLPLSVSYVLQVLPASRAPVRWEDLITPCRSFSTGPCFTTCVVPDRNGVKSICTKRRVDHRTS